MAADTCQHVCPCHLSSRRLLIAATFALGLLCHHVLATPYVPVSLTGRRVDRSSDRALLWRDILADSAGSTSTFERAFTTTFNISGEFNRTLGQFTQLVRWVEETSQPTAAKLAFLPEFGSDTAVQLMRAGVQLSKLDANKPSTVTAALQDITDKLRSASPWRGYPATRRLLLGALVKLRVELGRPFPASLEQPVKDVIFQLFQLHKASVANRGVVQFFHISKSGGTNLCQAAEANGCASQGFDTRTNCLIRDFLDQPRWVTYTAHKYVQYRMSSRQILPWFVNFHTYRPPYTCDQRRAYLLRERLTFYANEYTNPPGTETSSEMCPDFVNLIMFRHPRDRLRSQIGWIQKLYKEYYIDVDTQQAFINRTTGFWERLMPAAVNNYYIRSLLGQRFFEFPVLQIVPEHITLAKLATLQHDILLTLEAMGRNEMALRVGLGWSQALRDGAVRSSTEMGDAIALPLDYDAMLERNAPDEEVYAFAREMQTLDTVLWSYMAAAAAAAPRVASQAAATLSSGTPAVSVAELQQLRQQLQLGGADGSSSTAANSNGTLFGACGYVSQAPPEALTQLQARLRNVEVPLSTWRGPGSTPVGDSSAESPATSATSPAPVSGGGAALPGGIGGSKSGSGIRSRIRSGTTASVDDEAGEAAWLAATDPKTKKRSGGTKSVLLGVGSGSRQRGPAVVSISRRHRSRHLLRLGAPLEPSGGLQGA